MTQTSTAAPAQPDAADQSAPDAAAQQAATPQPPHGYTHDKERYLKRMRRIEGQVRGVARMIEEDKYCIDVLTQISAVNSALHAVAVGLLEEHLGHCVAGAAASGDEEQMRAKVLEASAAVARLVRS